MRRRSTKCTIYIQLEKSLKIWFIINIDINYKNFDAKQKILTWTLPIKTIIDNNIPKVSDRQNHFFNFCYIIPNTTTTYDRE